MQLFYKKILDFYQNAQYIEIVEELLTHCGTIHCGIKSVC